MEDGRLSAGVRFVTEEISAWLISEPGLTTRARQIIAADERDSTALFPWWVMFLLFSTPHGGFNLNNEPKHDGSKVYLIKSRINRDDFRRVPWDEVRRRLTQ